MSTTAELPGMPVATGAGIRAKIQAFGGFLTAMVIPNVGAFIAWGFLTALFIPTGWLPNDHFGSLVSPIITYLLPVLLAFTGGKLIHGHRGGVIGALVTMGVIVGSDIPMFLGAMILGPLAAWILKKFDDAIAGKVRAGFEMLVNTFSLGIIGLLLTLGAFAIVGPLISAANAIILRGITALVETGFLPLLSIINEPAKVLFLNNVIDQGMYYPLGMQDALVHGSSIFFMVASNPGPGLGLLLAYFMFSRSEMIRNSIPGAMIIHFIGGIHEIYFPYVLMKPITILAMIIGAASGIATFQLFGVGLVAGPSPGSIISYLMLTPRGNFLGVIAGVIVATIVSFLITALILKASNRRDAQLSDEELISAQQRSDAMKAEGKAVLSGALDQNTVGAAATTVATGAALAAAAPIRTIVFACDAGMGSSAMGASLFRDRLSKADIREINVSHAAIESIPQDADVVVIHSNLADRLDRARPGIRKVPISNYLTDPALNSLFDDLNASAENGVAVPEVSNAR